MATLTVLEFPTAEGAETMLATLEGLQKQQLITVEDGAIVTWPAGAKKPKTKQLSDMTGIGALGGAFWGMLSGAFQDHAGHLGAVPVVEWGCGRSGS